jgi:hypothetical protein
VGAEVSLELEHGIIAAGVRGRLAEAIDDDGANDLAEELFLVREVQINGAFRDAGSARDIVESGAGEAAFSEDFEGGVEDLAWPLFREASPAWSAATGLCGAGRSGHRYLGSEITDWSVT